MLEACDQLTAVSMILANVLENKVNDNIVISLI